MIKEIKVLRYIVVIYLIMVSLLSVRDGIVNGFWSGITLFVPSFIAFVGGSGMRGMLAGTKDQKVLGLFLGGGFLAVAAYWASVSSHTVMVSGESMSGVSIVLVGFVVSFFFSISEPE